MSDKNSGEKGRKEEAWALGLTGGREELRDEVVTADNTARTWTWKPDGVAGLGHRTDVVDGARATSRTELGVGVGKELGEAPARRHGGFPGSRARAHDVLGAARSRARTRRGSTSRSARL